MAKLAQSGFIVKVHDPQVTQAGFEFEMVAQGHHALVEGNDSENKASTAGRVEFVGDDRLKAAQGASALLILTEWDQFKTYDYEEMMSQMSETAGPKTLYDFRQLMSKEFLVDGPFERAFQLGVGWLKQ